MHQLNKQRVKKMDYSFDDTYHVAYYLCGNTNIYLGSYLQIGIRSSMKDATKIRLADDYNDRPAIVDG